MNNFKRVSYLIAFLIFIPSFLFAEETAEQAKEKCLQGIEILSGFGVAKLREKGSYHVSPLLVDFDFDAKPLFKKIGINDPALLQFVLEPFVSYVSSPNGNAEIGNNFLIKVGFVPDTWKIQPYFKGGVGFVYITQHTREQGSQFNFNEYTGLGAHYFFKKNLALTVEYRYRHLSNAGMRSPNSGINTNYGICGLSYQF